MHTSTLNPKLLSSAMRHLTRDSISLAAMCAMIWSCAACFATAHPFHTTTAEMEFNSQSGKFEVALKIPASDFEHMVRAGAAMSKDSNDLLATTSGGRDKSSPEQSIRCASLYIEKQFVVSMAGKACRLEWVGADDEATSKWIYFELVPPSERTSSGEWTLTNKVLCDANSHQLNTVVFLSKKVRASLKTHERDTTVALPPIE